MFSASLFSLQFSSVYVLNGVGGRFDQTLANVNTLYSRGDNDDLSVYLVSEDSLSFVLEPVCFFFVCVCVCVGERVFTFSVAHQNRVDIISMWTPNLKVIVD